MSLTHPALTVGLPVFNGERYLRQSIRSLLCQTYEDFELIIRDNASTDGTASICQEFAKEDRRIQYIRNEENVGAMRNHNNLVSMARGKYFKWAAHDDECHPTMLQRCIEELETASNDVGLVYPKSEVIDENGNVTDYYSSSIESPDTRPQVRLGAVIRNFILGTPIYGVFRTELLKKTKLLGCFISNDVVLLGELALIARILEIPEFLFRKRMHRERATAFIKDYEAWMDWADPKRGSRRSLLSPGDKIDLEHMRSVLRSPLSWTEKMRCFKTVLTNSRTQRNRVSRWKNRFCSVIGRGKPIY